MKTHKYAELFPMMSRDEIQVLATDIKKNGLLSPVVTLDGKILDGRHRFEACKIAGKEPRFEEYEGFDPLGFVLSSNLHRRHLDSSQRAMIAAEMATMRVGKPATSNSLNLGNKPISQREAAEKMNVSVGSVENASKVLKEAPASVVEAVKSGDMTVGKAVADLKEKSKPVLSVPKDKMGLKLPEEMVADYKRAEEIGKELLRQASFIKCSLTNGIEEGKDVIWRGLNGNSVIAEAKSLWSSLKQMIPHAVCPTCQGRNRKKCTTCKQAGYVSEFYWKSAFPPEVRTMREAQIKAQK